MPPLAPQNTTVSQSLRVTLALTAALWMAGCSLPPTPRSSFFSVPVSAPAPVASANVIATPATALPAAPAPATPPPTLTAPGDIPAEVVPDPTVVAPASPLIATAPAAVLPWPAPSAAAGVAGSAWPSNWHNAWIALQSWSQFNGMDGPRQITPGLDGTFHLQTSIGQLRLKLGSQAVWIGGCEFWLGFAPRLIKGLPYIHSLDARKTFQPLLAPLPLLPQAGRTIVIDPGHGGKDSGKLSCLDGSHEKDYVLDWSRRVQWLLLARGWNAHLTRSNDTFVPLADRVAAADRLRADLFLSLHFNSAGEGSTAVAGVETYCLPPTGMPSNLRRGYDDDPREWLPNNAFDEQNLLLASRLHTALLRASGAPDRGVRRARLLGVLRGQSRPAVLIEGGYLSNPAEARKIATASYRQTLAEGVVRGLE